MNENDLNYLIVAGFGWTGSSAVVDLLKEFDGFKDIGTEFRTIQDPGGLFDLEEALVKDFNVTKSDIAIKKFLWLTNIHARTMNRLSHKGHSYREKINSDFSNITKNYVNELCDFTYKGEWFYLDYNIPKYKFIFKRYAKRLGLYKNKKNFMYFANPREEEFWVATRKYINNLFAPFFEENNTKTIILDQASRPPNLANSLNYFPNSKMIIVDRDPRDIYVDMVQRKATIGNDLYESDSAEKYIKWHFARRGNIHEYKNNNRVLLIKFEDLILNHENTKKRILDFLKVDESSHIMKNQYLKVEESKKNIGIYKQYENQKVLDEIYSRLHES